VQDLLNKQVDLTPAPKTRGAARRKEIHREKRSKALYNPHRVLYHASQENV